MRASMRFAEPWWLIGLLLVAALAGAYLAVLRRRRRDTMLFTSLAVLEQVGRRRLRWCRHAPATVSLLALALF